MNSGIFKKIMVATDGSELVKRAIDTAVDIARQNEAKLYAVYVISMGFFSMTLPTDEQWKMAFQQRIMTEGREATAYVENVGRTANVRVESIVLRGNPADEIISFAERKDIDLIVMGTQGRTGIKKFLLGSVAENVVRHSKKSVLVVRGETAEEEQ
ncbi:universal stress protein [Methanosarcina hadiensis]|uniref:universal stress protein n=1 Tax=Methanosarcina hadiensis TaxID=3078083 RepID=UPI003977A169